MGKNSCDVVAKKKEKEDTFAENIVQRGGEQYKASERPNLHFGLYLLLLFAFLFFVF